MLCSGANEGGVAVRRVKLFGASDEVTQREISFRVFSFVAAVDERPTLPRLIQKREIVLDGRLREAEVPIF